MPFIPHTEEEIQEMLNTIGAKSIDDLFDEIPKELRTGSMKNIPAGLTEMELGRIMQQLAAKDEAGLCFIGAGAYQHHIPAAVWDVATRGEFMTAYTPYQAEASQGTLQLLYEYQTMMASLTGMDVSNASLYDGGSALSEAILMAIRANKNVKTPRVLIASTSHPHYRQTAASILKQQDIHLTELPFSTTYGRTPPDGLNKFAEQEIAAIVIQQPNFFGVIEPVDELTDWAHAHGALVIAVVNPIALAVLKEPGKWGQKGADIVCGEGQPLGIPVSSGGPYFGFLCCKQEFVRQMPGRIIGRTVDKDGKPGFALTLQAREQHIRRAKATSNICTNQGLMVTAATIFMSLLGPEGLRRVAAACHANTVKLVKLLTAIPGVERVFANPFFNEVVIRLPVPVATALEKLAEVKIQGGCNLKNYYPELGECLLVCATEIKTDEDLQFFADELRKVCSGAEKKSVKNNNFESV